MRETASLLAALVDRKERISNSVPLPEQNAAHMFHMCIHGECVIKADIKVFNRLREWSAISRNGHRGKVKDDLTYL